MLRSVFLAILLAILPSISHAADKADVQKVARLALEHNRTSGIIAYEDTNTNGARSTAVVVRIDQKRYRVEIYVHQAKTETPLPIEDQVLLISQFEGPEEDVSSGWWFVDVGLDGTLDSLTRILAHKPTGFSYPARMNETVDQEQALYDQVIKTLAEFADKK